MDSLLQVVMLATDALLLTLKSMFQAMGRDRLAIASKEGPVYRRRGESFAAGVYDAVICSQLERMPMESSGDR